jgi:Nuclease-related domain
MDRETGPEPIPTGPAAPADGVQGFPAPSRGSMAGLAADPRLPIWTRRAIVSLLGLLIIWWWQNWRVGLTAAVLVAIADTIYQSKRMSLIPATARAHSAQRRTKRRLFISRVSGYIAVHGRGIPGTESVIDHLVVGPGGVFAVDSERWDRRLPVRTSATDSAAGPLLYHGPFSQKSRLTHARWEAAQAARLLSAELGREIDVRPVMVIYGPTVPWTVTNLRGVDVFSGRKIIRYFSNRNRRTGVTPLSWEQAGEIFYAAQRALRSRLAHHLVPRPPGATARIAG